MALLILGLLALSIGRYPVTAETMVRIMAKPFGGSVAGVTAVDRTVVLTVRLPRVLTAMLVGAALATSGAALQGIFRNPLVSPGILGVASGAGLGAALCILILGRNTVLVQGSAFVFGILAMVIAVGGGGQDFRSVREWLLLAGEVTGKTDRLDALLSYLEETETEIAARTADVPREQRPGVMALHVPPLQARAYEWIETAGGVNVAVDMPRWIAQIDIEQLYAWDPEVIVLSNFVDTQPGDLYENTVEGYDFSSIEAVRDRRVYKIPMGGYRWDPPSQESGLMLWWLAKKFYPDLFAEISIEEKIRDFYDEFYAYQVTDDEIDSILASPGTEYWRGFR